MFASDGKKVSCARAVTKTKSVAKTNLQSIHSLFIAPAAGQHSGTDLADLILSILFLDLPEACKRLLRHRVKADLCIRSPQEVHGLSPTWIERC